MVLNARKDRKEQTMNEPSFLKRFFKIYIVLVLQNVITLSVNLADNMMLGAYSEVSLSGVAAVNQIQFIFQQILMALGDGLVIFCSQYWGKKQTEPMKKIAATAMHTGILIALVLFVLVSLLPSQIVGLFTTDAAIIAEGVSYLRIIRFTYLFFAVSMILLATLRSVEVVKIAFYLSIMAFFVNCGINYVLIYGHFGFPAMGVKGAAIGTLVSRILECAVLIVYIAKKENRLNLHLKDYFQADPVLRKDYLKLTAPMLLVNGLWGANNAIQTAILGHMTDAAIAANSVSSTLFLMIKSMAVGASSTASVIIGQAIGTGDIAKVKNYALRLQKIFLCIGVIGGVILFFLRVPILRMYNLSETTKDLANTFLMIQCIVFVGMSYQMPTNCGIIRGGGDTIFVMKMDIISIWGIVLPISFLMAFVFEASPVVVFCCLNADQLFKCIPAFIKSHYGNWIKKLTRE